MYKTKKVYIDLFTDASSSIDGKDYSACSAVIMCANGRVAHKLSKVYIGDFATNNYGELSAIKHAIELFENNIKNSDIVSNYDVTVRIISDSKYSIECVSNWSRGWIKKNGLHGNWIGSSGKEVENMELIRSIVLLLKDSNVKYDFYHIHSHTYKTNKQSSTIKKFDSLYPNFEYIDDKDYVVKMNDEVDKLAGTWKNIN